MANKQTINPNHFYICFQGLPYAPLDSAVKWGDRLLGRFTFPGKGQIAMVFEEDQIVDNLWYSAIDDNVEVVELMEAIPPTDLGVFKSFS